MDDSDPIPDDDITTVTRTVGEDYDALTVSVCRTTDIFIDREIATDYERIEYRTLYNRTRVIDISFYIEDSIYYCIWCDSSCEESNLLEHGTASSIGNWSLLCNYPSVIEVEFSDVGTSSIADDTDSLHTITSDLYRCIRKVSIRFGEAI
jgi:hypothetical protein